MGATWITDENTNLLITDENTNLLITDLGDEITDENTNLLITDENTDLLITDENTNLLITDLGDTGRQGCYQASTTDLQITNQAARFRISRGFHYGPRRRILYQAGRDRKCSAHRIYWLLMAHSACLPKIYL